MHKKLDFTDLLKRSFLVVWKHKIIWVFGILLAFTNGPTSFNSNFNLPGNYSDSSNTEIGRIFNQIANYIDAIGPERLLVIAIIVFVLFLVLGLILFFLSALLRGSLINLVETADKGEIAGARPALATGWRKMLPIVGMNLLLTIPLVVAIFVIIAIAVLVSVLFVPVIKTAPAIAVVLSIITAILLASNATMFFIVLGITVSIVIEFAQRIIVVGEKRAVDSIRQAFLMLSKNLSQAAISWLVMLAAGIPFSIAMLILLVLFAIPVVLLGFNVGWIAAVILAIPLLLLMIIPAGYWNAFVSAFWTHVYLVLRETDEVENPIAERQDKPQEANKPRGLPGDGAS